MSTASVSGRAVWVERHLRRELTPFQQDCVDLICDAQNFGPYDFPVTFRNADWNYGHTGVRFVIRPSTLATFDFAGLTRLVVGAHDKCIRIEIEPCNMQRIAITMFPRRGREGSLFERHPTIEDAIKTIRGESC